MCSAVQCCLPPTEKGNQRKWKRMSLLFLPPIQYFCTCGNGCMWCLHLCILRCRGHATADVSLWLPRGRTSANRKMQERRRDSEELRDAVGSPMIASSKMKDPGGEECTKMFRFHLFFFSFLVKKNKTVIKKTFRLLFMCFQIVQYYNPG